MCVSLFKESRYFIKVLPVSSLNISNETSLADTISYHIIAGNFVNETETYPNETIGRTLLNDSNLVTLEGNQSQVLAWSKLDNGSLFVMNQGYSHYCFLFVLSNLPNIRSNITVVNTTSYNGTAILAIDSVLAPPPNISAILNNPVFDLTLVASLLQSASLLNGSSIFDALSSAHGITLFAPNNAGVQAAQGSLAGISKNATALQNDLSNHVGHLVSFCDARVITSNRSSMEHRCTRLKYLTGALLYRQLVRTSTSLPILQVGLSPLEDPIKSKSWYRTY